jgi:hypothetical protein
VLQAIKAKLSLYLIMQLATMPRRHSGSGGIAPPFLTSALDDQWSASHLCHITPTDGAPGALDRRPGGPQSQSERFGEKKNLLPLPEV